jgi:glycosyltransferase involved in cell wall biosynthesis
VNASREPAFQRRVSVLLPAHDEAATITDVVQRCRACVPGLCEVLVVDDGSTDETAERAEAAGARVLRLSPNRGKGGAVRYAAPFVEGEIVVLLDADGQDPPEEIPRLLAALEDDVDLVVGSRFMGTFEAGSITPVDRLGNRALTWLFNRLAGTQLTDTQAGFRALRASLLSQLPLRAQRYDLETTMLVEVLRRGGRIVEVPVTRLPRAHGSTGLDRVRDGSRILLQTLRLARL